MWGRARGRRRRKKRRRKMRTRRKETNMSRLYRELGPLGQGQPSAWVGKFRVGGKSLSSRD